MQYFLPLGSHPPDFLGIPASARNYSHQSAFSETLRAEPPKVPGILVNTWKELLRLLQGKQLTSLLLQHMLTAMLTETDPSSLHSVTLAAWLRLVLLYESSNCE